MNPITSTKIAILLLLGFPTVGLLADDPKHLTLAQELVKSLTPENNLYNARPTAIVWPDEATKTKPVSNNSVCSSFGAALLRKSYRLSERDLIRLFTEEWPEADEVFVGITTKREFEVIPSIEAVKPGDFIVVDYQSEKAIPTGHVMLVSGEPKKEERYSKNKVPFKYATAAKTQTIEATSVHEWHVAVIDSSKSPHGKTDTRYQSAAGENDNGVGEGPIRILTNDDGKILGYTWSTYKNSSLWLVEDRPIAIARWKKK